MAKFSVTVTRVDEYEIELDEKVFDEKWMANFRESFYSFNSLREHAQHLAQYQARFGKENGFIEGYGYITRDGALPFSSEDFKGGKWKPEAERRKATPGINIRIVSEDDDIEFDTTKL